MVVSEYTIQQPRYTNKTFGHGMTHFMKEMTHFVKEMANATEKSSFEPLNKCGIFIAVSFGPV